MHIFKTFTGDGVKTSNLHSKAVHGVMNIAYMDMGQGDCTLVSTPDNTLFIIDCGSSGNLDPKTFEDTKKMARLWAEGNTVYMIMTHHDKDHYNKFIKLITAKPAIPVAGIYFSGALRDDSPLGNYYETALGANLSHFGSPNLVEVTLNKDTSARKVWRSDDEYAVAHSRTLTERRYTIMSDDMDDPANANWEITIIAGNVASASGTAGDISNTKSLVTKIRLGTDKLILTGDATDETIAYLLKYQSEEIKEATMFQIPHHGSETATPTKKLCDLVNPQSLIISVGLINNGYNLPKQTVVNEWLKCSRLNKRPKDQKRVIDYWIYGHDKYKTITDLNTLKTGLWAKAEVLSNKSKTFYWLADPDDKVASKTGFYGFTNKNYFVYRKSILEDLYMTGIEGSYPDDGFED